MADLQAVEGEGHADALRQAAQPHAHLCHRPHALKLPVAPAAQKGRVDSCDAHLEGKGRLAGEGGKWGGMGGGKQGKKRGRREKEKEREGHESRELGRMAALHVGATRTWKGAEGSH